MDKNQTVFALLVAIDKYHPDSSVPHLSGCKNDIGRIDAFLSGRIEDRYQPLILTDEQATKKNIIAGFETHLAQATKDDSILFYYSGHGSQSMTARKYWRSEPDKLDETLVAYDSRTKEGRDLADKELAYLISKLAESGAHITIIMDCCHSGDGTRKIFGPDVASRRMITDERPREAEDYFFSDRDHVETRSLEKSPSKTGWVDLPKGGHILLAACRSSETAKEKIIEGERRGIFSHYLLESLQAANSTTTYRDLFMRTNARVRANISEQSPQMDSTGDTSLNSSFLGGSIQNPPPHFTVAFRRDSDSQTDLGWFINGGEIHGIKLQGEETTELAIFNFSSSDDDLRDLTQALALIKVTQVEPTRSQVSLLSENRFELDANTTYKAVVTNLPIVPLLVKLEGDKAACKLVSQALNDSKIAQETTENDAVLRVIAQDDRFTIQRSEEAYALVEGAQGFNANSAQIVVNRLAHIGRWHNLLQITNPQSELKPADIEVTLHKKENNGSYEKIEEGSDISLLSTGPNAGEEAILRMKVRNRSDQKLFFMLLVFGEAYEIASLTEGSEINGKWLEPGQSFTPFSDLGGIPAYIPAKQWNKGITTYKQTIKIIATTEESFADDFSQKELPISAVPNTRSIKDYSDTLSRLMDRTATRAMGRRQPGGKRPDWTTIEISATINQPKERPLAKVGEKLQPTPAIAIQGHSGLTGSIQLSSLPVAARSTTSAALPHVMRDNPILFQPAELSGSRSGAPGLSVLELTDAKGLNTVNDENPLKITLSPYLKENETLLALGYIDGYLIPLDIATQNEDGETQLSLNRLPDPAISTRSLKSAVTILFQKYAHQVIGTPYHFPRLSRISVSAAGEVSYASDLANLKQHVSEANKIALYIHGFIGETDLMASSSRTDWLDLPNPVKGIDETHDLILAFDYENINTSIEDVAQQLKDKLSEVGLSEGHEKTLNIIAHSMGGLVSRWFIEVLNGNKIVNHLVMLGTPNAGSPLPKIEDWLLGMATVALNSLAIKAWPLAFFNAILRGIEKIDVSLDQMNPSSDFLKNLSRTADPEIPYTIIAGKTSLMEGAIQKDDTAGIVPQIWARATTKEHKLAALADFAFLLEPNDIAVSVESVSSIPSNWANTQPDVHVIPSDHMSYFILEEGLIPLVNALLD